MNVKRILQKFWVHVQSTWFPLIDRIPQQFVDIYHAKSEGFRMATQHVHGSAEHAMRIMLRLLASEMKRTPSLNPIFLSTFKIRIFSPCSFNQEKRDDSFQGTDADEAVRQMVN